jgi:hypothetical protein
MAWLHAGIGPAKDGSLAPNHVIRKQLFQQSDQMQPADHLPGGQTSK